MEAIKKLIAFLQRPSAKYSVLALVGSGLIAGIASVVVFNVSLHATSTEEFCVSCHEMADNPGMMLKGTTHFMNESGVRPTCADCHVPQEFIPKMIRKIEASREVWGHFTGIIDTPEKYAAHAPAMKAREIARLKANDSQECRNCHDVNHWLLASQSAKAQAYHKVAESKDKTCVDCHAGLTHTPKESLSAAAH